MSKTLRSTRKPRIATQRFSHKPKSLQSTTSEAKRVAAIRAGLAQLYPHATCELNWKNPYELICATILSAQCTDVRVNMVTPEFFRRWPDAFTLARADAPEVEDVIRSTGFYRNKTKSLLGMAHILVDKHHGKVPQTMNDMLELPGVARKTANVVLGTAFGLSTGIVVDTHITRLSQRLGLSREKDPNKIERDLMNQIPQNEWVDFGHRLIWHGRRVCEARKPKCDRCLLAPHCPSADVPGISQSPSSSAKKTSS